ncbi:MAG: PQQ-like beta-propeller repeat protein [Deltaproteobacteria bacterium]|nr:PQQ-like beta-propeller repeat protein [Deltaproteobacteria bacterium]
MRSALAVILVVACGSDPTIGVASRWVRETPAKASPVALGPERRVVVLLAEPGPAGGELVNLEEQNGLPVEGPTTGAPLSLVAPAVAGTSIFAVSSIGKLVRLDFLAQIAFAVPEAPFGRSTPPLVAVDGSVRIGTTAGRIFGFAANGDPALDLPVGGAVTSIAVDSTTTYATTDLGRVVAFDESGAIVFDVNVDPPASGLSVSADGTVYVGDASSVRAIDPDGEELWKRPRGARVVGTRVTKDDTILAWGEDGIVERLSADGDVVTSGRSRPAGEANPPAFYAAPVDVDGSRLGAIDATGRAILFEADGSVVGSVELGGEPNGDPVTGELGFTFVAVGASVHAIDFTAEQ